MKVPLCKMYNDKEIETTVLEILKSGYFINGPNAKAFEKEFAAKIGVKYAISVNSGTSALFLIYLYLNLQPGDEIIVPSHTFIATISPALFFGVKPVFVDVDPLLYTLDVEDVKRKITSRTKAVVPVHLYGHPADLTKLKQLCEKYQLTLIEDCAQAHGAKCNNQFVGSIGDFGCFSFFPSKIMTVGGDGGMIVTNNQAAAEKLQMLKNHGRMKKYYHEFLGLNMRLAEIPAAIGRIQLQHLDEFNQRRGKIVDQYNHEFSHIKEIQTPSIANWADPVFYVYTIQVDDRDKFQKYLQEHGISTNIYYPIPVHQQPLIIKQFGTITLPITEKLVSRIISLPLSPWMTEKEIHFVITTIKEYFTSSS